MAAAAAAVGTSKASMGNVGLTRLGIRRVYVEVRGCIRSAEIKVCLLMEIHCVDFGELVGLARMNG